MNKIFSFWLGCFGLLVLLPWACGPSPSSPAMSAQGTVTATSGDVFSPTSVTITHGGSATFVLGGGSHTLYIDNGSGTCAQNFTTWPQTITFSTVGTYNFHCSLHSPCGSGSCVSCTGMTGQVIVQ